MLKTYTQWKFLQLHGKCNAQQVTKCISSNTTNRTVYNNYFKNNENEILSHKMSTDSFNDLVSILDLYLLDMFST